MRRTVRGVATALVTVLAVVPAHAEEAGTTAAACVSAPAGSRTPLAVDETVADASPGLVDSRIHWTRWSSLVTHGETAGLAGQVIVDGGAVPEASVDLYARDVGTSGWQLVSTTSSDPDTGVFAFDCLHPDPSTDYRAVYDGSLQHRESSGDRRVRVARSVPDQMTQVSRHAFRYTGEVRPYLRPTRVLLQARTCRRCSWRNVDSDTTGRGAGWAFRIDGSGFSGRRWFRAMVPASDGYVSSPSQRIWTITSG